MNKKYILIFLVLTLSACSFKKGIVSDLQSETKTESEIVNQISEVDNNLSSETKTVKKPIVNEANQSVDLKKIDLKTFIFSISPMFSMEQIDDNNFIFYSDKENQINPAEKGVENGFVFFITKKENEFNWLENSLRNKTLLEDNEKISFSEIPENEYVNKLTLEKKFSGFTNSFKSDHTQKTIYIPHYTDLLEITMLAKTQDFNLYLENLDQLIKTLQFKNPMITDVYPSNDKIFVSEGKTFIAHNIFENRNSKHTPEKEYLGYSIKLSEFTENTLRAIKKFDVGMFGNLSLQINPDSLNVRFSNGGPEGGETSHLLMDFNGKEKLKVVNRYPAPEKLEIFNADGVKKTITFQVEPQCPTTFNVGRDEIKKTSFTQILVDSEIKYQMPVPIQAYCLNDGGWLINPGFESNVKLDEYNLEFTFGNNNEENNKKIKANLSDLKNLKFEMKHE